MSEKQDRTGARTAADLERKYNFGKTFAEMLGLINDSRDKVDSVKSELRDEITETKTTLERDTESIKMRVEEIKSTADYAASDASTALSRVASLSIEVDNIEAKVEDIEGGAGLDIDADAIVMEVVKKIGDGVDRVETSTGYRFDAEGMTISKSGHEMANKIDNTGMYVTRSGREILTANKDGVNAMNLHAKTYLIVGSGDGRSRFEDYQNNRTGCFWIR